MFITFPLVGHIFSTTIMYLVMILIILQSFEGNLRTAAIFQWNAIRLRARLSDFRKFKNQHRFPILAIIVSEVDVGFQLSGCERFHSDRSRAPNRVLWVVRRALTYVSHVVGIHLDNEYVSVTASRDKTQFTLKAP